VEDVEVRRERVLRAANGGPGNADVVDHRVQMVDALLEHCDGRGDAHVGSHVQADPGDVGTGTPQLRDRGLPPVIVPRTDGDP